MTKEDLKTQMLAGIITESEYRVGCEKLLLTESKKTSKKSLKENIAYHSIIGAGEKTPKTDYERAFEHFLGGKVNEVEDDFENPGNTKQQIKDRSEFLDGISNEGRTETIRDIIEILKSTSYISPAEENIGEYLKIELSDLENIANQIIDLLT